MTRVQGVFPTRSAPLRARRTALSGFFQRGLREHGMTVNSKANPRSCWEYTPSMYWLNNKLGTIYVFTTCLYGSTIVYDIGCMMMYIYMYILYTPKKLSFHLSVPSIWSIWSTKDSLVWPPWHTLDTSGRQAHVARSLRFILYIKGKIDENWTKRIANATLVRDKFQHLTRRENHSYPHHW